MCAGASFGMSLGTHSMQTGALLALLSRLRNCRASFQQLPHFCYYQGSDLEEVIGLTFLPGESQIFSV
jgi:hypothetical protein